MGVFDTVSNIFGLRNSTDSPMKNAVVQTVTDATQDPDRMRKWTLYATLIGVAVAPVYFVGLMSVLATYTIIAIIGGVGTLAFMKRQASLNHAVMKKDHRDHLPQAYDLGKTYKNAMINSSPRERRVAFYKQRWEEIQAKIETYVEKGLGDIPLEHLLEEQVIYLLKAAHNIAKGKASKGECHHFSYVVRLGRLMPLKQIMLYPLPWGVSERTQRSLALMLSFMFPLEAEIRRGHNGSSAKESLYTLIPKFEQNKELKSALGHDTSFDSWETGVAYILKFMDVKKR